jgi:hypothetical protein
MGRCEGSRRFKTLSRRKCVGWDVINPTTAVVIGGNISAEEATILRHSLVSSCLEQHTIGLDMSLLQRCMSDLAWHTVRRTGLSVADPRPRWRREVGRCSFGIF